MVKLSVLVCTIPGRETKLARLLAVLEPQAGRDAEILVLRDDKKRSIGAKRNALLAIAEGEYAAFVDDDDEVSHDYVSSILEATEGSPDVVCFDVFVTGYEVIGHRPKTTRFDPTFDHENRPEEYRRKPNHIMAWRTSIAKRYLFTNVSFGEDDDQRAEKMCPEVKRVARVDRVLYSYKFDPTDSATARAMQKNGFL